MAPSDLDLEGRLRDLRFRAGAETAPPPDLAGTVRALHRRQRRNRVRLAAAGLAAALIFIGVPVLASSLDAQRSETANPSEQAPRRAERILDEQPTRGSLAGDEQWLAGIAARELVLTDPSEVPATGPQPEQSIERRTVAFAGDVPGERIALVVARLWGGRVVQAWFTGPVGAEPAEMTMTLLRDAQRSGPLALIDLPDPASSRFVLVVVAFPGDEVEVMTGRTLTASGETVERWEPVPTDDGAGSLSLDVPAIWLRDMVQLRITPAGEATTSFAPGISDRAAAAEERASIDLTTLPDPRGLLGVVDESALWGAVHHLVGTFGSHPDEMGLTLLAGGPVEGRTNGTVLVGATLPSGDTVGFLAVYEASPPEPGSAIFTSMTAPAPAGTALLDRVFAMGLSDTFVVCGPTAGTSAELYDAGGTLVTTMPLVEGAGAIGLPAQQPALVRILDGSGALVVSAPVTEPFE